MNIQPISNTNISMGKAPKKSLPSRCIDRIKQKIIDVAPSATIDDSANKISQMTKFDEMMAKPAENRGLMGATAIILQPSIDAMNKKVDDTTRTVSICRTISKIVAGTLVGIAVRGSCYKLVKKMTDINGTGKYSKSLLPKKYIKELSKNEKFLNNYRSALSTATAIVAMCYTNFGIDAPLTIFLTNKLTDKALGDKKNSKISQKEVSNEQTSG